MSSMRIQVQPAPLYDKAVAQLKDNLPNSNGTLGRHNLLAKREKTRESTPTPWGPTKTRLKDCGEATKNPDGVSNGKTNTTSHLLQGPGSTSSQISRLEEEKKGLKEGLAIRERELQTLLRRQESQMNTKNLLAVRQQELVNSRSLVTTFNTLDFQPLKDSILRLNMQIETISQRTTGISVSNLAVKGDTETIKSTLGPQYVPFVSHVPEEGADGIMKALLQIFLCNQIHGMLFSWNNDRLGYLLSGDIYHHVLTEEQGIAGKWKELTCRELRNDETILNNRAKRISTSFVQILSFFGRTASEKDKQLIDKDIQSVVRRSGWVGKRMKTIVNCDIIPVIPKYGDVFNENEMVDRSSAFGICEPSRECDGQLVLGTAGIGCNAHVKDCGVQEEKVVELTQVVLQPRV